jgi:hypothetical protein
METALTQFVNWVDNMARGIRCEKPNKATMEAAGFGEIDGNYWAEYQEKLISSVEGENIMPLSGGVEETDTRKLQEQEIQTLKMQTSELSTDSKEIKIIPNPQEIQEPPQEPAQVSEPAPTPVPTPSPRKPSTKAPNYKDKDGFIVLRRPANVPKTQMDTQEDKPLKKDDTTTVVLRRPMKKI